MLNPKLQIQTLRTQFEKDRYVLIEDFLDEDCAHRVLRSIEDCAGEFLLRARNGVYPKTLTFTKKLSEKEELVLTKQLEIARDSKLFSYLFYLFLVHPECANHAVCALSTFLGGETFRQFIRDVSSEQAIVKSEVGGVTRLHRGHYVGPHSDQVAKLGNFRRKVALILYFCQQRQGDMGGVLELSTPSGHLSLNPGFNQVLLMDVDAFEKHWVTEVQVGHPARIAMPGFFSVALEPTAEACSQCLSQH